MNELIMTTPPIPPPFDIVSEPICALVNIIKGGQIEEIPGIGTIFSVFRYVNRNYYDIFINFGFGEIYWSKMVAYHRI